MNKDEAKKIEEPIVKAVVDCIAARKYYELNLHTTIDSSMTLELFEELVEGFLEINELPYIDGYDIPCNFKPKNDYSQMCVYIYNNGTGFAVDYDLTTDGEPNDLTLQMKFLVNGRSEIIPVILDAHVL